MEKKYCPSHKDSVCILKTGTTAGKPSYGKHFYMCSKLCGFNQNLKAEFALKVCPKHGGIIGVRRWTKDDHIQYKCQSGWCGTYSPTVPASTHTPPPGKENAAPAPAPAPTHPPHHQSDHHQLPAPPQKPQAPPPPNPTVHQQPLLPQGPLNSNNYDSVMEELEKSTQSLELADKKEQDGRQAVKMANGAEREQEEKGETPEISSGREEQEDKQELLEPEETNGEESENKKVVAETFKVGFQSKKVIQQINEIDSMLKHMAHKLPDGGANLKHMREELVARLTRMKKPGVGLEALQQQQDERPTSGPAFTHTLAMQARMLTNNVVEHLHKSLKDCHYETIADPAGLTVSLMSHQSKALSWMTWREKEVPSGGILADDMGLGKTLTVLSLMVCDLGPSNQEWLRKPPAKPDLVKCAGTLVVCPASLMLQWESEVKLKFETGTMKVLIYHGPSRTRDPRIFRGYDVVITTYHLVGTEASTVLEDQAEEENKIHPAAQFPGEKKKPKKKTSSFTTLFGVHWRRMVLDEAHTIRNPKAAVSIGCCLVTADSHWAVTGTPIQNKLQDLYSLVKFLQLAPFDDAMVWKSTVEKRGSVGMKRLDTLVSALVLRRTKEEIGDSLRLTEKIVKTHQIQLKPEENDVYRVLFREAQKVMYRWLEHLGENPSRRKDGSEVSASDPIVLPPKVGVVMEHVMKPYMGRSSGTYVLGLLLRLRQSCCHVSLLTKGLKKEESDSDNVALEVAMGALTLEEESTDHSQMEVADIFQAETSSTKIDKVVVEIKRVASLSDSPPQKCVVVSQWTSMLDIVAIHLDRAGLSFSRIDGTVKPSDRQSRVGQFNSSNRDPMVMLLSLQAGGVGLNLIGGNHVFLLDLHWNPALEQQAADRCHRVGQHRPVYIHKFVCQGTVEERILSLQAKKLELAKNVLEGASNKTRKDKNKLSLNELKMLFEIV